MGRSENQGSLSKAGLTLLVAAVGSSVAPVAADVICDFTLVNSINIASRDGYVEAVLDLAAYSCGEGPEEMSFKAIVSDVAVAMAEAVAFVEVTCTSSGAGRIPSLAVDIFTTATARAEAVGQATASIIASANVCNECKASLQEVTSILRNVSVEAVAEARVMEEFKFTAGEVETFSASAFERVVEQDIVEVLGSYCGTLRAISLEACTGEVVSRASVGEDFAECDVEVVAGAVLTERNTITSQAVEVQAVACAGETPPAFNLYTGTPVATTVPPIDASIREIAVAVSRAISTAQVTCERSTGPGITACASASASVNAIATATATAFVKGLATVVGVNCVCNLANEVSVREVEEIISQSASEAAAEVCADGESFGTDFDFQEGIQERIGEAITEVVVSAIGGETCRASSVKASACAQVNVCIQSRMDCSSPEGILPCCEASEVCAQLPGRDEFQCMLRRDAEGKPGTEVIECE